MHLLLRLTFLLASTCLLSPAARADRRADPSKPFEAIVIPTIQYANRDFYDYTPDNTGPNFQGINRVFAGQRLMLVVLASNFLFDTSGRADVVYDLDIAYPGGKTEKAGRNLTLCTGPVPDVRLMAYARKIASFSTDPGDPTGDYGFTVTARDRTSGATSRKTVSVRVEPFAEPALPADFQPDRWMAAYYQHPAPAEALPALFKFAAGLPKDNADAWPPILGFYEAVLKDNPWLAPVFLERLKSADDAGRTLLLFVLGYAWRNEASAGANLPAPLAEALAKARHNNWPEVDAGELQDPRQLDVLWGRFFATGAFAPIARITSALALHRSLGALDKFKANPPASGQPTPEMMQELVLKSAQWSLGANARRHPLVRHYAEWILAHSKGDTMANILLASALGQEAAPTH
jgi:hypothetical protein